MKRMGSSSRLTEPPCGITKMRTCPSTAARAMATPISARACTPQWAGFRLSRARASSTGGGAEASGVLIVGSLPSLALPSSARRRRHLEGGQVRRVGARKRLLSSSARSSAGPPQCTAGTTAGPLRVSPCPAVVHSPLWRMWIRTFSRACRLTTAVDKTLTTTTSLDTTLTLYSHTEIAIQQVVRHSSRRRLRLWARVHARAPCAARPCRRPPLRETPLSTRPANWARLGAFARPLSTYLEQPVDNPGAPAAKCGFAQPLPTFQPPPAPLLYSAPPWSRSSTGCSPTRGPPLRSPRRRLRPRPPPRPHRPVTRVSTASSPASRSDLRLRASRSTTPSRHRLA